MEFVMTHRRLLHQTLEIRGDFIHSRKNNRACVREHVLKNETKAGSSTGTKPSVTVQWLELSIG